MTVDQPSTNVQDQRRARRFSVEASVRMRFEADAIQGISDNVSQVGLMFFTEEPLRVTVEVDEDGETRTYTGRLMRLQRLNETNTGLAVEFDDVE